jgi:hypothetical protein
MIPSPATPFLASFLRPVGRRLRPAIAAAVLPLAAASALVWLPGCAAPPIIDAASELADPATLPDRRARAIELIPMAGEPTEAELEILERHIWESGQIPRIRVAAARRLAELDHDRAMMVLRRELPNLAALQGLAALCELIAEEQWAELTPALVSSWARPVPDTTLDDLDRPEARALSALYGADRRVDVVFEVLAREWGGSASLRTRAWELLHRLGERERLAELVAAVPADSDDAMMNDLATGLRDLGILPQNREEMLWLRRLREPARRGFWIEAESALASFSPERRLGLELRDVPVAVSVVRHRPDLAGASLADLEASLFERLRGSRQISRDDASSGAAEDRLRDWRGRLTWGDLAAMHLALDAFEVPAVREHLLDYADRDREDRGTEYGGVIALDERGRYEILEFPPRMRTSDRRFVATQAMLDAAYTGLFHFHLHVQEPSNAAYAGPGFGDRLYAESVRANCLVFTSLSRDELNVDYYRHGRVSVDLGTVRRPASASASGVGPGPGPGPRAMAGAASS